MKPYKKIIFILCMLLGSHASIAEERGTREKFLCQPTKRNNVAVKPMTYGSAYTDNDATKNAGKFGDIYLDKILIKGVIKDKRCVPVANADIEMWQEDEYGKKRYNKFSYSFTDRYNLNMEQFSTFLGIATTTSDNNGYFSFISVMPNGKLPFKQSVINIAVSHADFPKLESQIIFNSKSKYDKRIVAVRSLRGETARLLPTYDIEIILDGTNKYKTY